VTQPDDGQAVQKVIGDVLDAATAAAEIVSRGEDAWNADRLLRLAAEAVINRIGDAAGKLPEEVRSAMPSIPWEDIRANRILVAHIYHRIDPAILWATISTDVPALAAEVRRWLEVERSRAREVGPERDKGLDIGF
jgi:uncharacterized protein with HEPN domain